MMSVCKARVASRMGHFHTEASDLLDSHQVLSLDDNWVHHLDVESKIQYMKKKQYKNPTAYFESYVKELAPLESPILDIESSVHIKSMLYLVGLTAHLGYNVEKQPQFRWYKERCYYEEGTKLIKSNEDPFPNVILNRIHTNASARELVFHFVLQDTYDKLIAIAMPDRELHMKDIDSITDMEDRAALLTYKMLTGDSTVVSKFRTEVEERAGEYRVQYKNNIKKYMRANLPQPSLNYIRARG